MDHVAVWTKREREEWAKYDEARPGSLHLAPPASKLEALRRDYDSMQLMFFSAVPPFDRVLETLQDLEARINNQPE